MARISDYASIKTEPKWLEGKSADEVLLQLNGMNTDNMANNEGTVMGVLHILAKEIVELKKQLRENRAADSKED